MQVTPSEYSTVRVAVVGFERPQNLAPYPNIKQDLEKIKNKVLEIGLCKNEDQVHVCMDGQLQ